MHLSQGLQEALGLGGAAADWASGAEVAPSAEEMNPAYAGTTWAAGAAGTVAATSAPPHTVGNKCDIAVEP